MKKFAPKLPDGIQQITSAAFQDRPDGCVLEGPLIKVGVEAVLYLCVQVDGVNWWIPSLFNKYYGEKNWRDNIVLRVMKAGDTFKVEEVSPKP